MYFRQQSGGFSRMAKELLTNDQIILKSILQQKRAEVAPELSEAKYFEIFVAEQWLKNYDLNYDEIELGNIGDGGDGGIDGLYAFLNGDLVTEDTDTSPYKKDVSLTLYLIQAKTSPGFSETAVDKFVASTRDLLNLSTNLGSLKTVYNADVLKAMGWFRKVHTELAARFPSLTISYVYASQGEEVHDNVRRRVDFLRDTVKQLFSNCSFEFAFVGAPQLLELARQAPKRTYDLRLVENPISAGNVGYLCLVRVADYFDFISLPKDSTRVLNWALFESNVRDYQGATEVNEGIATSLRAKGSEDFWWLNNGVTILSTRGAIVGKTLTLEDPQIVNGLQTSVEVFKYLSTSPDAPDDRNILVRVIVPTVASSRERIIRATNSQTQIPAASLRATDEIHRDIEDHFATAGLFYDRRKNFHKNAGRPKEKIVSIPYLAQAVMAIVLQEPDSSRARPSSLLKSNEDYRRVFNPDYPVDLFLKCARIMKTVESFLRTEDDDEVRLIGRNNVQFHVATLAVAMATGQQTIRPVDMVSLDLGALSEDLLRECRDKVTKAFWDIVEKGDYLPDQLAKSSESTRAVLDLLK